MTAITLGLEVKKTTLPLREEPGSKSHDQRYANEKRKAAAFVQQRREQPNRHRIG